LEIFVITELVISISSEYYCCGTIFHIKVLLFQRCLFTTVKPLILIHFHILS